MPYTAADGQPGNNINLGNTFYLNYFMGPIVDRLLYVLVGVYDGTLIAPWKDYFVETYDIDNNHTQASYAGMFGAPSGWFVDGDLRSTASAGAGWSLNPLGVWDGAHGGSGGRWLHPRSWSVLDPTIAIRTE